MGDHQIPSNDAIRRLRHVPARFQPTYRHESLRRIARQRRRIRRSTGHRAILSPLVCATSGLRRRRMPPKPDYRSVVESGELRARSSGRRWLQASIAPTPLSALPRIRRRIA